MSTTFGSVSMANSHAILSPHLRNAIIERTYRALGGAKRRRRGLARFGEVNAAANLWAIAV
jgi:hypothetical protein